MLKGEYETGFRKGLNEARYADNPEEVKIPEVDDNNLASIGYADGIDYGKYLVMVGMKYAIKEENLIAVIDKSFMRACDKKEKVKKYK